MVFISTLTKISNQSMPDIFLLSLSKHLCLYSACLGVSGKHRWWWLIPFYATSKSVTGIYSYLSVAYLFQHFLWRLQKHMVCTAIKDYSILTSLSIKWNDFWGALMAMGWRRAEKSRINMGKKVRFLFVTMPWQAFRISPTGYLPAFLLYKSSH